VRTFRWSSAALAAILTLAGGTGLRAQQAPKPVNIDGKVLRQAGTANDALPGSWLSYGRNQSETRYSTLKQINDTNAKRLGAGVVLRGRRGGR
jgi:glucose dehydrogenase